MNVNIDVRRINFKVNKIRRVVSFGYQFAEGLFNGVVEIRVPYVTIVGKEILFSFCFPGTFRFSHKSRYLNYIAVLPEWDKFFLIGRSHQINDALFQAGSGQLKHKLSVIVEGKGDVWIYERNTLKFFDDMPHFSRIGFQKIATRRNVVKKIFDHDGRARLAGTGLLAFYHRTFNNQVGTQLIIHSPRSKLHLSDGSYGSQSFAPESEGVNPEQIVGFFYLGCCMAFETHSCIGGRHSTTVIDNLQQRFAGIFHNQFDV